MNRYARPILAVILVLASTACASAIDEDPVPSPRPTGADPSQPSPTTSASPQPTPRHDMGEMDGSGQTAMVDITNFAYAPVSLTVRAGTEVTFTNLDSAPHTVTAGSDDAPMPALFDSGLLVQGDSFTFVFDQPGTFVYFCDRHPPMEGSITVEQ